MNGDLTHRPSPLEDVHPSLKFLALMGFFFLSLAVFGYYVSLVIITQIGHVSIYAIQNVSSYSNHQVISALKVAQIVSSFGGFVLPAAVFSIMASHKRLAYLKLNTLGKLSTLLLGGLLMWCAIPLINGMAGLNGMLHLPASMHSIEVFMKNAQHRADVLTNAFLAHQTFGGMLVNLFMIGILAAVAEELFFRAVLQKIMIEWTKSVHVGVWLTGIIFSFMHFEFYGFLPRMLMGVYLGYLFVWSKSIWVPIFAHFLNNGSAVVFAYLEDKNMLPKNIDQIGSSSSQVVYIVLSALLVAALMVVIYKIEHKKAASTVTS